MIAERPAALFVNPGASSAGSWRVRRAVELTRAALDADLHTSPPLDPSGFGTWLAEQVAPYRTAIVAGGDGTLAGAYNALAGREDVTLGYLPAGFGNASARLLRLPRDPVTLSAVLATGEARPFDLVAVDGRLALFVGIGWDAEVAVRYGQSRAGQHVGWGIAIVRSLPDLVRRHRIQVEADGQPAHDGPMEMLVVGTTPWYGLGLQVNPGVPHDQGRITMRIYRGPLPGFGLEALRWVRRRAPRAEPISAAAFTVRATDGRPLALQADGDALGEQDEWRLAVRPSAIRLIGRFG